MVIFDDFKVGDSVEHAIFGIGKVMAISGQGENQRVGIFNGDELLGEGYILKNVPRATSTDAKGSWFGTSFTDLIGVSDNIRNLQNYVAGKRNSFESN